MRILPLLTLCVLLAGCESDADKLVRLRQEEAFAQQQVEAEKRKFDLLDDSLAAPSRADSGLIARTGEQLLRVNEAEAKVEVIQRDIGRLLR